MVKTPTEKAIRKGLHAMGYPRTTKYDWILTDTHQLINHGVAPASGALQCADCHDSISRMDLQGELGYQLKAKRSNVCAQCHGDKGSKDFQVIHKKHVDDKNFDCSSCHTFSRPERNLAMGIPSRDN